MSDIRAMFDRTSMYSGSIGIYDLNPCTRGSRMRTILDWVVGDDACPGQA
jgi:hypothetical protein